MIIETTDDRLFQVRETGDADLAHLWLGVEVKRTKEGFAPKTKARPELVRKEAARIVENV